MLGYGTCSKPVLDVGFKTGAPNLDKLPEGRLLIVGSVESLDIGNRGLITSKDIDVSLLDGNSRREISVPVELRLFSPAVVLYAVNLASLGGVIEPRPNGIDEAIANRSKTVPLSRVNHVRQLDQSPISELKGVVA